MLLLEVMSGDLCLSLPLMEFHFCYIWTACWWCLVSYCLVWSLGCGGGVFGGRCVFPIPVPVPVPWDLCLCTCSCWVEVSVAPVLTFIYVSVGVEGIFVTLVILFVLL